MPKKTGCPVGIVPDSVGRLESPYGMAAASGTATRHPDVAWRSDRVSNEKRRRRADSALLLKSARMYLLFCAGRDVEGVVQPGFRFSEQHVAVHDLLVPDAGNGQGAFTGVAVGLSASQSTPVTRYPAAVTAPIKTSSVIAVPVSTVAVWDGRSTVTLLTPGTDFNAFSTVPEQ